MSVSRSERVPAAPAAADIQITERAVRVGGHAEVFLTFTMSDVPRGDSLAEAVRACVNRRGLDVLSVEGFGHPAVADAALDALDAASGGAWPCAFIGEKSAEDSPRAALHVWAASGLALNTLRLDGRVAGVWFDEGGARYCRLTGIAPGDAAAEPGAQTSDVFARFEQALSGCGLDFSHVMRTWFFNREIVSWYKTFNDARDDFFYARGVFDGLVPASTGIGGTHRSGAALQASALAVRPEDGAVKVRRVHSPLQCPALDYGSSFSRAVEVETPTHRRLFISGTASIAPEGHTIHVGDTAAQIVQTFKVVEAILHSCDMTWASIARAIAYFKHEADMPLMAQHLDMFQNRPLAVVHNDVCRDDLLFELELDAIEAK